MDPAIKAMFARLGIRLRDRNTPEDAAEDVGLVAGGGGFTTEDAAENSVLVAQGDTDEDESDAEDLEEESTLSEAATQPPSTTSQSLRVGKN